MDRNKHRNENYNDEYLFYHKSSPVFGFFVIVTRFEKKPLKRLCSSCVLMKHHNELWCLHFSFMIVIFNILIIRKISLKSNYFNIFIDFY